MESVILRSPSVGSVIKKIIAINPDLPADRIIAMVKQSIRAQGEEGGEFAQAETIDEGKALRLARATLGG